MNSKDRRVGGDNTDSRRNRDDRDRDSLDPKSNVGPGGDTGNTDFVGGKRSFDNTFRRSSFGDRDRSRDRDRDRDWNRDRDRDGYNDRSFRNNKQSGYGYGDNNSNFNQQNYNRDNRKRDSFPPRRDDFPGPHVGHHNQHRGGGGGRDGGRHGRQDGRGQHPSYSGDYPPSSSYSSRKDGLSPPFPAGGGPTEDRDRSFTPISTVPMPAGPPPPLQSTTPIALVGGRMPPLMSFKTFAQSQREDVTQDSLQRLYDQYCWSYLQDFSKAFFSASMAEEWFQERYNPLHIHRLERDATEWGVAEAARIKQSVLSHPHATVGAMSLEPQTTSSGRHLQQRATTEKEAVLDKSRDEYRALNISGKHFSGHEHRAVYICGVHACCPKQIFKNLILEALAVGNGTSHTHTPLPAPERIIIAQPLWSTRFIEKFERYAWVIMPTEQSARAASTILKDLKLNVPGPIDPHTGEPQPRVAMSFSITATIHTTRNSLILPDHISHGLRVQMDTEKAQELARLLDEEKNIPQQSRLEAILSAAQEAEALKLPTDKLDVSIAYLRRVHFMTFYGAKRYRDEAHMLTMAPSVVHRTKPFVPIPSHLEVSTPLFTPAPPTVPHPSKLLIKSADVSTNAINPTESSAVKATDETTASSVESSSGRIDVNKDVEKDVTTEVAAAADDDGRNGLDICVADEIVEFDDVDSKEIPPTSSEAKEVTSVTAAAPSSTAVTLPAPQLPGDAEEGEEWEPTAPPVQPLHAVGVLVGKHGALRAQSFPLVDRRIEAMIADLTAKIADRRARRADPNASKDGEEDEDVKAMLEIHEKVTSACILSSCKSEKEGKARCCYVFCNKLFKDADFLRKHLVSKHPTFAADLLLVEDEPFMRKRFEQEDLSQRPLPPVEVEVHGSLELRSVRELRDKFLPPPLPPLPAAMTPVAATLSVSGGSDSGVNVISPPPMADRGHINPPHGGWGGPPPYNNGGGGGNYNNNNYNNNGGGMGPSPHHHRGGNRRHSTGGDYNHGGGGGNFPRPHHPQYQQHHHGDYNNRGNFNNNFPSHGHKRGFEEAGFSGGPAVKGELPLSSPTSGSVSGVGAVPAGISPPPSTPDQPRPISGAPFTAPVRHYIEPKSADNNQRKLFCYVDVDAPKETAVSIDYGVAILPVKKRKLAR